MALNWQLVNIPVDGGLNDKASPVLVEAPTSSLMFDAVFDKNGEIVKRNGWTALAAPGSGTPHTIGANRHLLAAKTSDGTYLYEQSQAAWSALNRVVPVLQKPYVTRPVTYPGELATSMASSNSVRCFVQAVEQNGYIITFTRSTSDTSDVKITAINVETGDVVFDSSFARLGFTGPGGSPVYFKAAKHSTRYVVLLAAGSSSNQARLYTYDTTTHAMVEQIAAIASPSGELFDVCHGASVSVPPAMAYRNGAGGITVNTIQTDGETSASSVSFNAASYDRVAINTYNTGYVIAARVTGTNVLHLFEIDTAFSTLNSYTGAGFPVGPINQLSIIQTANGYGSIANSYIVAYGNVAALTTAPGTEIYLEECKATGGVLTSSTSFIKGIYPSSAFFYSDLFWLGTSLCVYLVPDMNGDQKALDGALGITISKADNHDTTRYNVVSKISAFDEILQGPVMDAGQYILDRPSTGTAGSQGSKVYINASKYNASVVIPTVYELAPFIEAGTGVRSRRYGSGIVFSGGCTTSIDAVAESEVSPVAPPFIMSAVPTGGGAAGAYFYRAVVEFTDANGLLHRSAPSNVVESQRGATGSTILTKLFRIANAGYYTVGLSLALYRTTDGGSIFYRIGAAYAGSTTDSAANTDAVIADNEVLYTDSGELEAQSMFATDDVLVTSNRMWAIPSDDKASVWYTKTFTPGIFPEFNSGLRLSIPAGGDNIALGQLDDKVVVFKRNSIFVIFGQGPNNLGQGGDYAYEQIQTNVGCIEPSTVVSYPEGLMFAHSSGVHAINRNLQVQPIGIPVDDTDPTTLCSAVSIPQKHQVRFGVRSSSVTLYYSYLYNRWSRLLINQTASTLWTNAADDEQDQLVYLTNTGGVRYEASASSTDNAGATSITLLYQTPWIKLAGIQGTQRIRRAMFLLRKLSDDGNGSVTVYVYYDYVDTIAQTKTWNAPALSAAAQDQLELTLSRQKIQSVKFRVQIFADTAEVKGRGYALAGITLDAGIKKGLYKQQAAALRV